MEIYKKRVAISYCDKDTDDTYQVISAKVADKLLTVKHVEASFVLVRLGDVISVSARSTGTVNVQLIMEKCGGGGHFEMAGAQFRDISMKEACHRVNRAISAYFSEIESDD